MSSSPLTLLAAALLIALSVAASAQPLRPAQQAPDIVEQTLERMRRSGAAAEAGAATAEPEGAGGFAALLQNPDDVGLNLQFALTRIREGRLEIAASALQRVLLTRPDLSSVRLLYAIVLYRLDNLDEAKIEFGRLSGDEPTPEVAATAREYLERIAERQRAFRGQASLGLGITYDRNRNFYPLSGQAFSQGVLTTAAGSRHADWGRTAIGTVGLSYDPGRQQLRDIFLEASGLVIDQVHVSTLDTAAASVALGLTYRAAFAELKPALFSEMIRLDRANYLYSGGLRVPMTRFLAPRLQAYLTPRLAYESYNNSAALPTNAAQNGVNLGLGMGVNWVIAPELSASAGYELSVKRAREDFETYLSHLVRVQGTYGLPLNLFLLGSASYERRDYEGRDPSLFPAGGPSQQDNIYTAGLTLGLPLAFLDDFTLTLSAEFQKEDSNLPNYTWQTWRFGSLMTKRWNF